MKNINKISCIITVGKNFHYLKEAVYSLLNQSYKNIEIIIINDGDYNQVKDIIRSIDSKKILLYNSSYIGRGKALNLGIKKASGNYISILDSDDIFHTKKLEIQLKYSEKYDIVCTRFSTNYKKFNNQIFKDKDIQTNIINKRQFIFRNPVCHSSVLINKNIFDKFLYDENRANLYDYELWIRINYHNKIFLKIEEDLTFKRIHKNQQYENKKRIFYIYSTFLLKISAFKKFKQNNLDLIIIIITTLYSVIPQKIRSIIMGKI